MSLSTTNNKQTQVPKQYAVTKDQKQQRRINYSGEQKGTIVNLTIDNPGRQFEKQTEKKKKFLPKKMPKKILKKIQLRRA